MGDRVRTRRLDLGLLQKQLAAKIGVNATTIWNWECHKSSPQIHVLPQVTKFIGYNPFPEPTSEAEKLVVARKALGLTQKAMARKLGVDPTTLHRWENGVRRPSRKILMVYQSYFLERKICDVELDRFVVQTLSNIFR